MKRIRENDMKEINGRHTVVLLKKPCRVGGQVENMQSRKHTEWKVVTVTQSVSGRQLMWTGQPGVADVPVPAWIHL